MKLTRSLFTKIRRLELIIKTRNNHYSNYINFLEGDEVISLYREQEISIFVDFAGRWTTMFLLHGKT